MDLQNKKIPTIFTAGFSLILLWILLFVSLVLTEVSLVYLASFLLVLVYGSKIYSHLSSYNINTSLEIDRRETFPGKAITLKVTVENKKFLPVRIGLELPDLEELADFKRDCEEILVSHEKTSYTYSFTPRKRGVYYLAPLSLYTSDLPGLYLQSIPWREEVEVVVYPPIHPRDPIHFMPLMLDNQEAESLIEDPLNPIGTREYIPLRPARFINWKASARHGHLQEYSFAKGGNNTYLLVIDVGVPQREENLPDWRFFEEMVEEVASLAVALEKEQYPIGLMTNSRLIGEGLHYLPAEEGPHQLKLLLETLARLTSRPRIDLVELLERLPPARSTISLLFQRERREALKDFFQRRGLSAIPLLSGESIEEGYSSFYREERR